MYNIKLLKTPTGNKLLRLFDKMEKLISELYHNTDNDMETEYFEVYDEIKKLKEVLNKSNDKRVLINKSY